MPCAGFWLDKEAWRVVCPLDCREKMSFPIQLLHCAFEDLRAYFDTKRVLLFWEAKAFRRCLLSAMIEKSGTFKFLDLGASYILVDILLCCSNVWEYQLVCSCRMCVLCHSCSVYNHLIFYCSFSILLHKHTFYHIVYPCMEQEINLTAPFWTSWHLERVGI